MDESALRNLFKHATEDEPPLGPVVRNSLTAGLRLRRRRRVRTAMSCAAVVAVVGVGVPLATGSGPAAPLQAAAQPQYLGRAAYVIVDAFAPGYPGDKDVEGWVTPISLATHQPGRPIKTGVAPSAMVFTPHGHTAYVANYLSGTVTPISTTDNLAGKPIKVGKEPSAFAVTPNGKTVYVVNQGSGTVTPISTATNRAGKPIRVPDSVGSIAMSPDGKTLYAQTVNAVVPISTATNTAGAAITLATGIKAGQGAWALDTPMVITPDGRTLYVLAVGPNINAVVPVHTGTGQAGPAIPAGFRPDALVVSPDGRTLYAGSANSGSVTMISTATNKAVKTVKSGGCSGSALAITPNGRTVYTADPCNGFESVVPIATATGATGRPIKVNSMPSWLTMTPDGRTLFEVSTQLNTVTPIATATNKPGKPLRFGSNLAARTLMGIAIAP